MLYWMSEPPVNSPNLVSVVAVASLFTTTSPTSSSSLHTVTHTSHSTVTAQWCTQYITDDTSHEVSSVIIPNNVIADVGVDQHSFYADPAFYQYESGYKLFKIGPKHKVYIHFFHFPQQTYCVLVPRSRNRIRNICGSGYKKNTEEIPNRYLHISYVRNRIETTPPPPCTSLVMDRPDVTE